MQCKFTSDGKKVVIVGALNAKETIVQEIFVSDGTEFPAGEHFVVKTLLDAPAETYKAKEEKRIEQRIKELERERDNLGRDISAIRDKMTAAAAKLQWISGITESEVKEVFDRVKDFISGEITHILCCDYEMEIRPVGIDSFAKYENNYGRSSFDGIKLLSLFGHWNGRLDMRWRMNNYRDGSGGWDTFIPCKSLQEAIGKAKEIIYAKDCLSDRDYEFCLEYAIPVDETKNNERLKQKRENLQKQVDQAKERLAEQEAKLQQVK